MVVGFLFHTIHLSKSFWATGIFPVTNAPEGLSFFAWILVILYIIIHIKNNIPVTGSFLTPLALLFIIIGRMLSQEPILPNPILKSAWFPIHVTLAFIGNAFFGLAFISGVMYLLQEREIKSKRVGFIYSRLPSLKVLDSLNYQCLTLGFPFLTLAIISGAVWAEQAWGSYWSWDPKETWSLITWSVYAALLHARLNVGWRGRKAAIMSILGFVILLFTFLGVNYLLKGLHTFS